MGNSTSARNYVFCRSSRARDRAAQRDAAAPGLRPAVDRRPDAAAAPSIHKGAIFDVARWSDSEVVTCSEDKTIALFDINSRDIKARFNGHTKAVTKAVCSDEHLWSCSRDLSIMQWDVATRQNVFSIRDAHTLNITGLSYNSGRGLLCSGSRDYSVKLWDTRSLPPGQDARALATFMAPRNVVTCLKFDHTGNVVYQGSEDLCVRVWDCRSYSAKPVVHITGYVYFPLSLDLSPPSAAAPLLATGCKGFNSVGCDVKVWDLRNPLEPVMSSAMSGHEHDVNGCTFIDDSHIVTSSKDGTCALWDASVGSVTSSRTSTELSSDSHRLARYASPDTVQFTGVAAMSPEDVVAVGFNGTMRHLNIKRSVDDEYRFVVDFVSEGVDEAKANM